MYWKHSPIELNLEYIAQAKKMEERRRTQVSAQDNGEWPRWET